MNCFVICYFRVPCFREMIFRILQEDSREVPEYQELDTGDELFNQSFAVRNQEERFYFAVSTSERGQQQLRELE